MYRYLFTIIDITSPLATTTVDCANALFQGWVSRFGVPAVIKLYQGTQFTSSLWAALCILVNIQHNQTNAYHLQSNGMVERFHLRLKDTLRARCASANWVDHLPWASWVSTQQPGKTTAPPHSGSVRLTTHFNWPIFRFSRTSF
jgi:transposase InsO family protein